MKRKMQYSLSQYIGGEQCLTDGLIPVTEVQLSDLAVFFLDAYRDTIDYEGESIEDAAGELQNVMSGGYGPVIHEASVCLRVGDEIAAAVFITERDGVAFMPYIVTAKKYKGMGFARQLVTNCLCVLKQLGYSELVLYVTAGNVPAEHLYRSLGFTEST